jgi:hypothetical protein
LRSRNYEHNRFDGIEIVKLENARHAQGFVQLWRSDNVPTEVEVMSRAELLRRRRVLSDMCLTYQNRRDPKGEI